MKIVVVGPNCWGAGDSLRSALGKARINYPSFSRGANAMPYNAYEASDDFDVDHMGRIAAKSLKRVREVRYDAKGRQIVRVGDKVVGD
jgi:hypothetical protein